MGLIKKINLKKAALLILGLLIGVAASYWLFLYDKGNVVEQTVNKGEEILTNNKFASFKTDTSKSLVDLDDLLSGGPGKDGIPAISDPEFISISEASTSGEVLGIYVSRNGEEKFYPYNILVWHEIVNDRIGDQDLAITFCPLCGSAIVFNRNVNGETLEFGVSGFLFESNLVMYDKQTESFWSQTRGEAIVGEYTGTKLEIEEMQLITFGELKKKYPQAKVLSETTGYNRNYSFYPYGDYESNDQVLFPTSVQDKRFPAKEVFFIIPLGNKSIAFQQLNLKDGQVSRFELDGKMLEAKREGEVLKIILGGKELPGYFEMWFSWAIHHQKNGVVWALN